ncbi:MAG: translesion error-prone DNA polymerase V autoproteolytic subunit [Bacteroidia bacterium]|nr:translesion error-prone DNA polymerase V autoproteolytic subunit [Bacteroidia bacterium]
MSQAHRYPLLSTPVPAGFPNPASDHMEREINLNDELVDHPAATFFVRVEGNSMEGAGIHNGDILIVDKALDPVSGKIVIAVIEGEFTVKRLIKEQGRTLLRAENPQIPDRLIKSGDRFEVWGVVTYVIHKC